MFICFVLHSYIFTLINTLSTRGRRGELNEKFRKMHLKFGLCIHMFRGSLHLFRGSFQCGVCALLGLWLFFAFLWFWSWVELLCFYLFILSFSEILFALCVVNALIKGELRTRSVPVVDGWSLLSDEWLKTSVGLTLGYVRLCSWNIWDICFVR
jgi:hypothetical protein